ncbi:MAG: FkbM family methyltransferase [Lachnospiraceae bacterium]|nr:FkbM family methyltransferase [Lachnospiraceae bacterium]
MGFLSEYPLNQYEEMIEELKKVTDPDLHIMIRGGGGTGIRVGEYLDQKGINYEGYLVDREYYSPKLRLNNKPVFCSEDFLSENKCILVVSYVEFDEKLYEESLRDNIIKQYKLDFAGRVPVSDSVDKPLNKEFCEENKEKLIDIYNKLADDRSRRALELYFHQKLHGNLTKEYDKDQYFQDDIFRYSDNEVFVDCGAFQGENIRDFINALKKQGISTYKKIIAMEPDRENLKVLRENTASYDNIFVCEKGAWNETTELCFSEGGSASAVCEEGKLKIGVTAIDDIEEARDTSFIKMDIEGSELQALKGAKRVISENKPKLAICIYHKREDLLEISDYILKLRPDYRIYIRNHSPYAIETVLYAV